MSLVRRAGVDALTARPDPRLRAAVIHGADRTAVSEIGARLLKRLTPDPDDPFSVALLSEADLDAETVAIELSALSLTGGRRVVRLRLSGELGAKDKAIQEVVQSHLDDAFGSNAFLLVECGALDKRSGLRKLAEADPRVAGVLLYEEEQADIGRLARETLDAAGVRAPAPVLGALVERLPRDRGLARQTLETFTLYIGTGGGVLTLDVVDAVAPAADGAVSADIALSAFSGRLDQTAAGLRRARFLGESGPALLRSLSMHRARLARAKAAVEAGMPPQGALKSAGVFWKDERDVLRQLELWRRDDLARLQETLLAADVACKTAGSPDELIAHQAALDIARRAARVGSRVG